MNLELLGGTLGLIIALILVGISLVWMIFPFLVVNRLDKIVRLLSEQAGPKAPAPKPQAPAAPLHPDKDIAAHLSRKTR